MVETQQAISDWAEATFGPAGSNIRVAARANEEMAELLRCLTSGNEAKAAEEVADVVIVLCRLATRLGLALELRPDATVMYSTAIGWATSANDRMASIMRYLADPALGRAALASVRYCVEDLCSLAHLLGFDAEAAVDAKMAVNRARVWKLDGTGHGYHVRPEKVEGGHAG